LSVGRIRGALFRELDVHFASHGFRRVNDRFYGDAYYRDSGGTRYGIHAGSRRYLDSLEAQVGSLTVRFDAVEELVAKFEDPHPLIRPEDIAARSTLTVQVATFDLVPGDLLYGFGGVRNKLWLIESIEGVTSTAREMAAYAIEMSESVFPELSDADRALGILSRDDDLSRTYKGPDEARGKAAIALAFLTKGLDAAMQLADVKMKRLKGEARSELSRWVRRLAAES